MDFQVHGSLYHFAGPLEPAAGKTAAFSQLYFHDAQSAADIRGNNNLRDREFLIALHDFLETRNPFHRLYLTAKERLAQSNGPERILITPRMESAVEQGADNFFLSFLVFFPFAPKYSTTSLQQNIPAPPKAGPVSSCMHHIPVFVLCFC